MSTTATHDIVAKLWNLCNVLKDGGMSFHLYMIELTYLLFLKMAKETGAESQIPEGYRWDDLKSKPKSEQLEFYKRLLNNLEQHGSIIVKAIFTEAKTSINKSNTLATLVEGIDKLDWYNSRQESMGDIYEGLLEKNVNESKAGAGQYFTPRSLIDSIVHVMRPALDDIIQDPAAGTGGFLIAASRYICEHGAPDTWTKKQQNKYRSNTFYGMEHVPDTHRLALMNLMLHGVDFDPQGAGIRYGDTLSPDGNALPRPSLTLTNPPFGSKKGGGLPNRPDFKILTSNKQLCFLQHIYLGLKPGGRAAAIFPDNVLFESNVGRQIRADLMDKCNLHTILRLPSGIFYAQGVKTNVLFFARGKRDKGNTKEVWVYDLRTTCSDALKFGKRTPLQRKYFAEFEVAFGNDPLGRPDSLAQRKDTGEEGRFRRFSRQWIAEQNDNLDIVWLRDDSEVDGSDRKDDNHDHRDDNLNREDGNGRLLDPMILAQEAIGELEAAIAKLEGILQELGGEISL